MALTYADRAAFCENKLAKQLFQLLHDKKTNLALSADVTDCETLLNLAETLGDEICVLKTHVDILSDFTIEFTHALSQIARRKKFFIFEDRKFADIGNTVQQQYAGGLYHIVEWADIINAHTLPGPGIISGLRQANADRNRGLLLLAQMSSDNNLFDENYIQKTLEFAEQFPDFVMGFISQKKLADVPQWIYMTPGVQFAATNDLLGQRYHTPEKIIIENESDIIIVGRGIITAQDPVIAAKQYRAAGWQAYLSRIDA